MWCHGVKVCARRFLHLVSVASTSTTASNSECSNTTMKAAPSASAQPTNKAAAWGSEELLEAVKSLVPSLSFVAVGTLVKQVPPPLVDQLLKGGGLGEFCQQHPALFETKRDPCTNMWIVKRRKYAAVSPKQAAVGERVPQKAPPIKAESVGGGGSTTTSVQHISPPTGSAKPWCKAEVAEGVLRTVEVAIPLDYFEYSM